MGSLHSGVEAGETVVQAAQAASETTESIGHKCRVLNEKLDQLLCTLHEETATPQVGGQQSSSPRTSIDEGDQQNSFQADQPDQMDETAKSSTSTKEAKESRNESRAVRQKGVRKV